VRKSNAASVHVLVNETECGWDPCMWHYSDMTKRGTDRNSDRKRIKK